MSRLSELGGRAVRRGWWVAAVAIVALLAAILRFEQIAAESPYIDHWDEPSVLHHGIAIIKTNDWNPHYFVYPSLVIYAQTFVDAVHFLWLMGKPADELEVPLETPDDIVPAVNDQRWTFSHPSFVVWNRGFTVLCGLAAVLLAAALARAWGGDGPLAALLVGASTLHIASSVRITVDVPASTLGLAALVIAARSGRLRHLALAGVFAGLAASAKYPMGMVLLAPLAVELAAALRERRWPRGLALGLTVVGAAVAFLATSPFILLEIRTFLADFGYEIRHYKSGVTGWEGLDSGWPMFTRIVAALGRDLGWPALVAGLGGCLVVAKGRWTGRRRAAARAGGDGPIVAHPASPAATGQAAVLVVPLTYLAMMVSMTVLFERNLLLLVLALAAAADVAVGRSVGAVMDRNLDRRLRLAAVLALVIAVGAPACLQAARGRGAGTLPDPRHRAAEHIAARGEPVVVAAEIEVHPLDLALLPEGSRVEPLAEILCAGNATAALVPQRLETRRGGFESVAAGLDALVAGARAEGTELARFRGGSTMLGTYTGRPGLVLLAAGSEPVEPLPALCGPHVEWRVGDCTACQKVERVVLVPAGERLDSPAVELAHTTRTFRLEIPLASRRGAESRPRARVALLSAGGATLSETETAPAEAMGVVTLEDRVPAGTKTVRIVVEPLGGDGKLRVGRPALDLGVPPVPRAPVQHWRPIRPLPSPS